jgi:hypothetical protein
MEPRPQPWRQPAVNRSFVAALAVAISIVAGCQEAPGSPASVPLPEPTCGGIKIKIEGALPCDRIVEIAIGALRDRAPNQLARGVAAIDVLLAPCPRGEVPPQIDCGVEPFVQLVTVTFPPPVANGPMEPSLTVAVGPATGTILGIANPLIR